MAVHGATAVTELLQAVQGDDVTAAISHTTATEVIYKVARLETGDPSHIAPGEEELAVAESDLRVLQGYGVTIEKPAWSRVARIKAPGGISLGDAYGAALAAEQDATLVVGADPEFGDISVDIGLHRIRDEPV